MHEATNRSQRNSSAFQRAPSIEKSRNTSPRRIARTALPSSSGGVFGAVLNAIQVTFGGREKSGCQFGNWRAWESLGFATLSILGDGRFFFCGIAWTLNLARLSLTGWWAHGT